MARAYDLTRAWTPIVEETGTIQNQSHISVLISTSQDGPGIVLPPLCTLPFVGQRMFARANDTGETARIIVIDAATGGGGGATTTTAIGGAINRYNIMGPSAAGFDQAPIIVGASAADSTEGR